MKKTILAFMMAFSIFAKSQNIQDPEFSYRPYFVNKDGSLKNLERLDMYVEKGQTGYMGKYWTAFYLAEGTKSDLRIAKSSIPKCILKVEPGKDPADFVRLYFGKIKKKQRKFQYDGKPEDLKLSNVKIELKKIKEGVYEIIFPETLVAGEYAIIAGDSKVSCFGLD